MLRTPYLTFALLALLPALTRVQIEESVAEATAGGKPVRIEVFEPKTRVKKPALILLHGAGGLEVEDGGDYYRGFARGLARRGYVVLLPHFYQEKTRAEGNFDEWGAAVAATLDHAVARPRVDPARVGLVGFSLGAGLALERAKADPRVGAISLYLVAGGGRVDRLPPTLVIVGDADVDAPAERARAFDASLAEHEVPHELHVVPKMGHGFSTKQAADAQRWTSAFFGK